MSEGEAPASEKNVPDVTEGFDREGPWDSELVSMRNVLIAASVVFWGVVIFYANSQMMPRAQYGILFLGGILLLYIWHQLMEMSGGGNESLLGDLKAAYGPGNRLTATLLTLSAIDVLATTLYMATNFHALYVTRSGRALEFEIYAAAIFTLVIIYLTYRSFGFTFLAIVLLGIIYGRYGMIFPGAFQHGGIGWERLMRILVISVDGFFGFLTRLVAAWIALFLLYAGFLRAYGAFDIIMRLAFRAAGYIDSGIAQTAVLSSAVIGSVNGSQTANASMTGSFTIPLMKRYGIKPETAAGIEAVASTSGQVLPPVMGAGAFIMANLITGITYVDVIMAGLIPAAVLVVTIFMGVHYVSVPQLQKTDMDALIKEPMPKTQFYTEVIKYGIPMGVLIYQLGIAQVTVMTAALHTSLSMMLTATIIPLLQAGAGISDETIVEAGKRGIWETLNGARVGVIVLAPVAIILAAINGVVDILTATGVPGYIALTLMELSGGRLWLASLLAVIISILLGLGMPTTAAYTIVALLIAPTMIAQFLLPELAAHFFVFYAAILAGLTPPIATTIAVAAGIAGGDFWGSAVEGIKISAPLFVLPFVFVYHPEIVSATFTSPVLLSGALALAGGIAIIHGINYPMGFSMLINVPARIVFSVLGLVTMVHPSRIWQFGALALIVALYVLQAIIGKPQPLSSLPGPTIFPSKGDSDAADAKPK